MQMLHLLPRQAIMPPAAELAAVEGLVQLAFKAVQDVGDVGKTGGFQGVAGFYGALAAAANQIDGARFGIHAVTGLALYRLGKLRRIGLQVGVFVPRNVLYAGRAAYVEGLDLHPHVNEQCVGGVLYFLPGGAGF
jgi:hypothetical protein